MPDSTPKLYEGLFLMSQGAVSAGLGSALETVRGMLERAESEVVTLSKWEERRLAYPVENQKRGTYIITLFKVNPVQIANIERDCNLSEDVMRVMMTRADHMGETEIAQAIADAENTATEAALQDEESAAEGEAPKQEASSTEAPAAEASTEATEEKTADTPA